MNERLARELLLVRAHESPTAPPWSEADGAWASAEALRLEGADAGAERLLSCRAGLAARRLIERSPALATALQVSMLPGWLAPVLLLAALLLGLALDAVGGSNRINIIALPWLGLLAWNVGVYAYAVRPSASVVAPGNVGFQSALPALGARLAGFTLRAAVGSQGAGSPLARFAVDWARLTRVLQAERLAVLLHAGAAAMALGLIVGMYYRGLALEYRAGWESTFLGAAGVHGLVSVLLGPAAALSGIALPDPEQLAALRFSRGPGENAARWIHLLALTVGIFVLLPRGLLALRATLRARRLAADLPVALDAPYFQRLLRGLSSARTSVQVLPYSYQLPAERRPALEALLQHEFGGVELHLVEPFAYGEEADPGRWRPAAGGGLLLPLFSLSATPEREIHGVFLRALGSAGPALIDEADFRQRFTGSDGAQRLEERRGAWRRLLDELQLVPAFVDLSAASTDETAAQALRQALAARPA